jgi:hypothetical protein
MNKVSIIFIIVFAIAGSANAAVDLMFIVDESGSMSGEHEWIGNMVTCLDSQLISAGQTNNMYALVGFAAGSSDGGPDPRRHSVGGGAWGTAEELSTATAELVTSGAWEDGWDAINFGLKGYYFHSDALVNMILVTDEDRDSLNPGLTYDKMLAELNDGSVMLNVVVDCGFEDGQGVSALGVDAYGNAYVADGSGGYTLSNGGVVVSPYYNTDTCYVDLAWATGGAAWDLNQLRDSGMVAESFTKAFVDVKVSEIVCTPAPGAFLLNGIGVLFAGLLRRCRVL